MLSDDYLALNGLFSNVLAVLSLAELGIGSAINFAMYKPLKENDIETVKSLMMLYRRLYKITRLYNFINDTLVAESTVLGH